MADQCCQRPSEFTAAGNQATNSFVTDDDYGRGLAETMRPEVT